MGRIGSVADNKTELFTVMVACECPETATRVVENLYDGGFNVVGPVDRASTALALAAQSPISIAVVGSRLAGRRGGAELASVLLSNWGASSILIDDDQHPVRDGSADSALEAQIRGLVRGVKSPAEVF